MKKLQRWWDKLVLDWGPIPLYIVMAVLALSAVFAINRYASPGDGIRDEIHEGRIESLPAECQYVSTVFDYEIARCEFSEDVCYMTPGGDISCIGGKP